MAQDDKKINPNFQKQGDDKNQRRAPKFSIYWIYAIIAVTLIGYKYLDFNVPETSTVSQFEFQQKILLQGDVEKLEDITNKRVVRVYIKQDSLQKSYYQEKFKGKIPKPGEPLFEFSVTDWASYNTGMNEFYQQHPQLSRANEYPGDEGEWFGPVANTIVTILLFVGLWILLMRKVGGGGPGGGGPGAGAGAAGFGTAESEGRPAGGSETSGRKRRTDFTRSGDRQ